MDTRLNGWRLRISNLFCIPQRYVVAIMCFFCLMVAFTLRMCLNIAITQMVSTNNTEEAFDPNTCPDLDSSSGNTTNTHGEYDWNEETQGIILGAFYYGYIVTQIPAGIIIEKYGAKHFLGIGIAITAVLTLITPTVVRWGGNDPTGLIILRVIEGLAEGPIMPALSALMARWVPKNERATIAAIVYGGIQMGDILGTLVPGFLMSGDGNWSNVFYLFGGIGIIWFIFWQLLVYSDPRTHPYILDKEREILEKEIEEKSRKSIPWKPILRSMPVWAIIITALGYDWGYFIMATDLPKYMNDVLKFSIAKTGMLSALPHFVMWIGSFVYAAICDWSIRTGRLSIRNARKIFASIAVLGPGIFIIVASYAGCDRVVAVAMFCIAMGTMGACKSSLTVNFLDLTPNYAGATVSIKNTISAATGFVTPYLVGFLTPNRTQEEWRVAFWITFAVSIVANIVYIIFAKGEVQWWNDIEKNGYPIKMKEINTLCKSIELQEK